jgi:hypothetical protein
MRTLELTRDEVTISLTRDEVRLLGNSLNEVCHALSIEEFATRTGSEPAEAKALLEQLLAVSDALARK